MARVDPTLIEVYEAMKNPDLLDGYLRRLNLLENPNAIGYTRRGTPYFALCCTKPFNPGKPTCPGVITRVMKDGLPKFRCTICKSQRSAHLGSSAYCVLPPNTSFFNNIDAKGRPNRKVNSLFSLIFFCRLTPKT